MTPSTMAKQTRRLANVESRSAIHFCAHPAFFLMQGMVSTAFRACRFSTGSLMKVSRSREYDSLCIDSTAAWKA